MSWFTLSHVFMTVFGDMKFCTVFEFLFFRACLKQASPEECGSKNSGLECVGSPGRLVA